MIEICTLASGSKGNCVLIKNESTKILIDLGICIKKLEQSLLENSSTGTEIDACLITHEHIDHVRGLKKFSDKYDKPVYAHQYCINVLKNKAELKACHVANFDLKGFRVGDLYIEPFQISHDSVFAVGYRISDESSSIVYATDMGCISDTFLTIAKESDLVLIESNHDIDMLKHGRYPAHIKRRILSNYGHLSNAACANAIEYLLEAKPRKFILAHISEENNLYELAKSTTKQSLRQHGYDMEKENVKLYVAMQHENSGFIRSRDD